MSDHPTASYADSILSPQLRALGLNVAQESIVVSNVCVRLGSLLKHWQDRVFRQTALFPGVEEATFYDPETADLEVRAFVVVGIRNSLVEDLGASKPATSALKLRRPVLTDPRMRTVTLAAIEHFCKCDLAGLQPQSALASDEDVFGALSVEFPTAWRVLSLLANAAGSEVIFDPLNAPPAALPSTEYRAGVTGSMVTSVSSGIDPAFDSGLLSYLAQVKNKEVDLFFSDSFKAVTRNTQKLLRTIEFVLSNGAAFVTHNYYLAQNYASRRQTLLRPCHYVSEATAKLNNQRGLSERHKSALRWIRSQIEPS